MRHVTRLTLACALAGGMAMPAAAQEEVGVTISNFNDNFLTLLREAISEAAGDDLSLTFEDAQLEVGRQLSQVQNFAAAGLSGMIIAPVDGDSTVAMTRAAEQAGIPVVYTNNLPVNLEELPENQVFVGSLEPEAGQLQGEAVCAQAREMGMESAQAVILLGDLANPATRLRTEAAKEALSTEECSFIEVVDEQTATWQRAQASDLMTNWLTAGIQPDIVIANNDEMAIGAAQALQSAGVAMEGVIVAGIDATADALAAMDSGTMDVTVLQSAAGQGQAAVEVMERLIAGETVERETYVPFELVTPDNLDQFRSN